MFKHEERTVVHSHNETIDMFCTMVEMVMSAHLNKRACTGMISKVPTESLLHFRAGLIVITNWTDDELKERGALLSDDELMVRQAQCNGDDNTN